MKRIVFISFIFFTTAAVGQNSLPENIVPVQAGTCILVNGKATINLDSTVAAYLSANKTSTYFVELTPIGNCGVLKLGEKAEKSFTVAMTGPGSDSGRFDYVVFLKYNLIPLNQNIQAAKLKPGTSVTGK